MSVYTIADLHLSIGKASKSMDVFGRKWFDYVHRLEINWQKLITDNDTVVIPGDISWGMSLEDSLPDLQFLNSLPGKKIIMKGNHDFWWSTVSKMSEFFQRNGLYSIEILNNNALDAGNCIVAGTRGWFTDKTLQNTSDNVDYTKIINRETIRLRMSLDNAVLLQRISNKKIVVFFHFPPVWNDFRCDEFIDILSSYKIKECFFGHIHGCYNVTGAFEYKNILFRLISADFIDFIPFLV